MPHKSTRAKREWETAPTGRKKLRLRPLRACCSLERNGKRGPLWNGSWERADLVCYWTRAILLRPISSSTQRTSCCVVATQELGVGVPVKSAPPPVGPKPGVLQNCLGLKDLSGSSSWMIPQNYQEWASQRCGGTCWGGDD